MAAGEQWHMAEPMLRIASLVDDSIVDGPGLRLTVFTQGCFHNCRGCHNPHTHAPNGGRLESLANILQRYAENPLLSGITLSGGEPFLQAAPLAELAARVHELGGDVVTYTGFRFEDLVCGSGASLPGAADLLEATDILVDGPYIEAQRSLELLFRGSSNQRLLDRTAREQLMRALPIAMSA